MTDASVADVGQPEKSAGSSARLRVRRKIFYLVDSLAVGGTETQAVELALRMPPAEYDVTLGCVRAERCA